MILEMNVRASEIRPKIGRAPFFLFNLAWDTSYFVNPKSGGISDPNRVSCNHEVLLSKFRCIFGVAVSRKSRTPFLGRTWIESETRIF